MPRVYGPRKWEGDWTVIRVRRSTLASILRCREGMLLAYEQGKAGWIQHDSRNRVGLDQIIRQLVAFRLRHARRRKEHAERRVPPSVR